MHRLALFVVTCLAGGFGGALGSIIGHAFGSKGLMAGGVLGGIVATSLAAAVAVRLRWIPREAFRATAIGGALGFLVAAFIATRTLSTPVGPVLSTLLVGAGAVLGARVGSTRAVR